MEKIPLEITKLVDFILDKPKKSEKIPKFLFKKCQKFFFLKNLWVTHVPSTHGLQIFNHNIKTCEFYPWLLKLSIKSPYFWALTF
jgi:hypothetical protein